jgi:NAD(P)H-dependent flavin oxidoreductase YrpB (nitropropane dioxygenase family)
VSEGGGLGFLAAGYKTIDEVRREIEQVRVRTRRPFGVNVFFPTRVAADEASLADYILRLAGEAERYGVACGQASWSDDGWEGKLELVTRERPAVVSFTFGCPDSGIVAGLQTVGIAVWCTVTSRRKRRLRLSPALTPSSSRAQRLAVIKARSTTPTRRPLAFSPYSGLCAGRPICRSSRRAG